MDALAAAADCLSRAGKRVEWVVVTDRECGLEAWASACGHMVSRIEYANPETFSKCAFEAFRDANCSNILLFYTRRVVSPLIRNLGVWNIHPSLLPAFPGLHGVRDAVVGGARLVGATLHQVDSGLDTGPIVAQVCAPFSSELTWEYAEHLSYLQKVWLTLVWYEQLYNPHSVVNASSSYFPAVATSSPCLLDESLKLSYLNFIRRPS